MTTSLEQAPSADRGDYAPRVVPIEGLAPAPYENLSAQVDELFTQQETWPTLSTNREMLHHLNIKPCELDGSTAYVQFNPGRVRNTAKKLGQDTAERPCFLDANIMPEPQKGIHYKKGDIFIAGNPFPIVDLHLTLISTKHENQNAERLVGPGLELAHDLSNSHFVFYNGPKAGASAPDHAHLQAGSRKFLPIENDLKVTEAGDPKGEPVVSEDGLNIYLPENLSRTVVVMESQNPKQLETAVEDLMSTLPKPHEDEEPIVNILFTCDREWQDAPSWRVYIFPRAQFRPHHFDYEDDDERQILVSPASLEMAGIMVVARPEDYDRMNPEVIKEIYQDVSLDRDTTQKAIHTAFGKQSHYEQAA